jgi:hypothetical protein
MNNHPLISMVIGTSKKRNSSQLFSVSDNFNRADGALGLNWNITESAAETHFILSNNTAIPQSNDLHTYAFWTQNSGSFTNDQFSQVKLVNIGPWNGCAVRDTFGVDQFYFAFVFGANDYRFYLRTPGVYTQLVAYSAETWVSGDILRLVVIGHDPTLMFMYRNGNIVASFAYFDGASGITGGVPGIGTYNPTGFNLGVDDWVGGNAVLPSITITNDNFNRADSSTLGSNWINGATGGCSVSSNKCVVDPTLYGQAQCISACLTTFNINHASSVTIGNCGTNDWLGPFVRSNFQTLYLVIVFHALPNTYTHLFAFNGSGFTDLGSTTSATWNIGDVITLEATGTNPVHLVVKQNGNSVLVVDDTTWLFTGTHAGLAMQSPGGAVANITSWTGSNL